MKPGLDEKRPLLLDELTQYWGHGEGLPGLRIGMTLGEARAVIGDRGTMSRGVLQFVVGDRQRKESPIALDVHVYPWREITLFASLDRDWDGSFWNGARLVGEYVAGEVGGPKPKEHVTPRGDSQLRLAHRGTADGIPVAVRLAAEYGGNLDKARFEISFRPERPWSDLVGDALGIGGTLTSLVQGPGLSEIPAGGTASPPNDLEGTSVEVLHGVDGTIRVRLSAGPSTWTSGKAIGWDTAGYAGDLLQRSAPRHERVDGLDHECTFYRGLAGPTGPLEVQLTRQRPQNGGVTELLIRADASGTNRKGA